jgi:hypothetical protein
MSVTLSFVDER